MMTLQVKTLIDSLNNYQHFGNFLPRIAQILLLNAVGSNFKPVLKVSAQLFLVEVHPLLNPEVVLSKPTPTRRVTIVR